MSCVHVVGCRGEEYWSVVKVWGKVDYVHWVNDRQMWEEVAEGDIVVYCNGAEDRPHQHSHNNSWYYGMGDSHVSEVGAVYRD